MWPNFCFVVIRDGLDLLTPPKKLAKRWIPPLLFPFLLPTTTYTYLPRALYVNFFYVSFVSVVMTRSQLDAGLPTSLRAEPLSLQRGTLNAITATPLKLTFDHIPP